MITGHQSFADSYIESETESEFVVVFNENVDYYSNAVANIENMTNATLKGHPYQYSFVFAIEDGSYEDLQNICARLEELPEVKSAHTKWAK